MHKFLARASVAAQRAAAADESAGMGRPPHPLIAGRQADLAAALKGRRQAQQLAPPAGPRGPIQRVRIDVPGLGAIETRNYTEQQLNHIIGTYLSGVTPQGQPVKNVDLMEMVFAAIEHGEVADPRADDLMPAFAANNNNNNSETSDEETDEEEQKSELAESKSDSEDSESGELEEPTTRSGLEQMRHFTTGKAVAVRLHEGMLADESNKTMSKNARRDTYKSLGIGEHVAAGHIGKSVDTLKSQAANDAVGNFTWQTDAALLDAVQAARAALAGGAIGKIVEVAIPATAGFGVVKSGGKLFQVWPRKARIVLKPRGDLKTAYGITEVTDPEDFPAAYHLTKELPKQ